jgi:xylan 1,4-beta-xylosidase
MMNARDTIFMGPALANTVRQCDGLTEMMSFWTFSDVFEESGPIPRPFIGDFGLRAKGGINKPSYYAFQLLHELGSKRLTNSATDVIATDGTNGEVEVAAWNLVDPGAPPREKTIELVFQHVPPNAHVSLQEIDENHGNVLAAYSAMGSPVDPTPEQVERLNHASELPPAVEETLSAGKLEIKLSANALALIKVQP